MDTSERREVVRIAAVGSVDDGKSTLIGRLLVDLRQVYEDQLSAVERASRTRGDEYLDLALITDGLRAEREQGITIDVAYRYFAGRRRSYIVADCPGHVSYTRNMITGSSSADVALLLVDARRGVLEQTKRHAFIASLLRVPHVVVCVNKMDLVGYDEERYERVRQDYTEFAARLGIADVVFIPISALHGDNIVERSRRMSWYEGPSLVYHVEHVNVASDRNLVDVRFPVQWVVRPRSPSYPDYRGYAGQIASGVLKPGDRVVVLPAGSETVIEGIDTVDGPVQEAFPPMCVTLRLRDHVDIARGDMIARPNNRPTVANELDAMLCCLYDREIAPGHSYTIQHTTRSARAVVGDLRYRVDIHTLHRDESASALGLNEIGRVRLRTSAPLLYDAYYRNRQTGSFILIDETDNRTVAAGLIREASDTTSEAQSA